MICRASATHPASWPHYDLVLKNWVDTGKASSSMIVAFVSPSGQYLYTYATRISGTAQDGIYSGVLTVPALSESGVWTASVEVWDDVRNLHNYFRDQLAALGLPTTFTNN